MDMLLGKLLKLLRKRTGYTSQQLADALYISRSTYSRYENNLKLVEPDILEGLARFYDTTVEDFKVWYEYSKDPSFPRNVFLMQKNLAK